MTRRLYNLIFLKDQLEEIVCDFVDKEVYERIDHSIFNIEKLKHIATTDPLHREILNNISEISILIKQMEQKLT